MPPYRFIIFNIRNGEMQSQRKKKCSRRRKKNHLVSTNHRQCCFVCFLHEIHIQLHDSMLIQNLFYISIYISLMHSLKRENKRKIHITFSFSNKIMLNLDNEIKSCFYFFFSFTIDFLQKDLDSFFS